MSEALQPCSDQLVDGYLRYFYDVPAICPYEVSEVAIYRQGQFGRIGEELMACFLARGFRRNGNAMYTMACPGCRACIPIRVPVSDFTANRNQRRVWQKNRDVTVRTMPLQISEEKLALMARFFEQRYPGRDNTPESYYGTFFANSITDTMEVEYRLAGRLLGVAIVDVGLSWLNGVYFYFDPEQSQRSPGTFNILWLLDWCRSHAIATFYLGYFIKELSAMNYKANFLPHELFDGASWQHIQRQ